MLIVCAFFSCSDNDDPVNLTITPIVPDATLSLAVQTDNRVKSKGGFIEDGMVGTIAWDYQVKTLTAVVFNNNAYKPANVGVGDIAALFTSSYADPTSTPQIVGEVPSGGVFILLIANLEDDVLNKLKESVGSSDANARLSIKEVLELATKLGNEGQEKGLTMSSQVLDVTLEPGKNFIGFGNDYALANGGKEVFGEKPVELVRTVAAINLKGIILPKKPDTENSEYESVSFALDTVFVANVKSTAGLGTWSTDVTTIEHSPLTAEGKLNSDYYLAPVKYADQTGSLKTGEAKGDDSMLNVYFESISAKDGTDLTWTNTAIPPCYVYPNQNGETGESDLYNYTLLVLRGDYTYRIGDKTMIEKNRYYTVIVNDERSGSMKYEGSSVHKHIQRNTKYNVTLTIKGTGSSKPFDFSDFAHVAAQVEVANWNVIKIDQPVD